MLDALLAPGRTIAAIVRRLAEGPGGDGVPAKLEPRGPGGQPMLEWTYRCSVEGAPYTLRLTAGKAGGPYCVQCVELPGAIEQGKTAYEAIENGCEAIKSVLAWKRGDYGTLAEQAGKPVRFGPEASAVMARVMDPNDPTGKRRHL